MALPLSRQPLTPGFVLMQFFAISTIFVMVKAAAGFRNVSEALAFYGVYHRDPMNQFIHFFGVPGIIWSLLIVFAHLPLPFFGSTLITSLPMTKPHYVSWAAVPIVFYTVFYAKIDPLGAFLYAPVLYAMYASAVNMTRRDQELAKTSKSSKLVDWTGTGNLLWFAWAVHFFCWYIQIHPGHAIYEGAKPAVMDSVGGALTSAPLFAFYEGLWFVGINKALQEQTIRLVGEYTAKLCAEGATMRVCESL